MASRFASGQALLELIFVMTILVSFVYGLLSLQNTIQAHLLKNQIVKEAQ